MESHEGRLVSLSGCYGLLVTIAGGLLALRMPLRVLTPANFLSALNDAAESVRSSAHTTGIFGAIFLGVWLFCLTWAIFDVRRRKLDFDGRDAKFLIWMTLLVLALSALYELATNGVLALQFPFAVQLADGVGCIALLALPWFVWLRVGAKLRAAALQEAADNAFLMRGQGMLGLENPPSGKSLLDMTECSIVAVHLLPSTQAMYSGIRMNHVRKTMDPFEQSINRAEVPAVGRALSGDHTTLVTTGDATASFRDNLVVLNSSWNSIEQAGKELERWFDLQRQAAVAHLSMPPGARAGQNHSPESFPHETLAAIDAEWIKIRQAALEISRWFGDIPPDHK